MNRQINEKSYRGERSARSSPPPCQTWALLADITPLYCVPVFVSWNHSSPCFSSITRHSVFAFAVPLSGTPFPPPSYINKVLLGHSHALIHLCCFGARVAATDARGRTKPEIFTIWSFIENCQPLPWIFAGSTLSPHLCLYPPHPPAAFSALFFPITLTSTKPCGYLLTCFTAWCH